MNEALAFKEASLSLERPFSPSSGDYTSKGKKKSASEEIGTDSHKIASRVPAFKFVKGMRIRQIFQMSRIQSRSQSPRYPCNAPLDKGNEGSENEIVTHSNCRIPCHIVGLVAGVNGEGSEKK